MSGVVRALLALAIVAGSVAGGVPGRAAVPAATEELRIVFAALARTEGETGGYQAIYTASGNGGNIRRITDDKDTYYDWATWAMNGTKIVYTARDKLVGGGTEAIYMMNPDGSDPVKLTSNSSRNAQPKVSPDGRSLLFTSFSDEFPKTALYLMDLETLQVTNLSARHASDAGFDSDPRWTPDGQRIVFASSRSESGREQPTQIYSMRPDGNDRKRVTDDRFYNTDPSFSRDGRSVAISSYRGEGSPMRGDGRDMFDVQLWDWSLVVRDVVHGTERVLTAGKKCALRIFVEPCSPAEGPAWVPIWSPYGLTIGYLSVTAANRAGIYVARADGSGYWPLIEREDLSITWWDWAIAGAPPERAAEIGSRVPRDRILYTGRVYESLEYGEPLPRPRLFEGRTDRFANVEIPVGDVRPELVRWAPGRKRIVFTARVPFSRSERAPTPPPPPGERRRPHFTLDAHLETFDAPAREDWIAEQQVFVMDADGGGLRQLTTPWTEDWMDAIVEGEARGHTDPDVSPDGRYVLVTSVSDLTFESFILRIDLTSGEVVNLTSMTAGALPVADSKPRWSPDGTQIAFVSATGESSQIFLMNADGTNVRQLTDDGRFNVDPAWSPDGRSIAYGTYRGEGQPVTAAEDLGQQLRAPGIRLEDWRVALLDVATGNVRLVGPHDGTSAFRPAWSPDGQWIAYISVAAGRQTDIHVLPARGGGSRPLGITLRTKEESFDWR
ncbi:MAG TPA: hypothetical protein VFM93_05895 [Candidatus Limnocylindria bacterium]|nr:hypothetical protein [Candidatus Limnocylindria bacterium]